MTTLTELQRQVLYLLSRVRLFADNFFMTGGTALAECYLHHRYSDDLAFFTSTPRLVAPACDQVAETVGAARMEAQVVRRIETFAEIHVVQAAETVRLDFALDSPYRLEQTVLQEEWGLHVDSLIDIACNKLSALFDRAEPKDFVDVYFIHHDGLSIDTVIPRAKEKHVGLDEYWLARAMYQATHLTVLPRMIRPVEAGELRGFFLEQAARLMDTATDSEADETTR